MDEDQCSFFVWDEDSEEAREWLMIYGPSEPPETPSRPTDWPRVDNTPLTLARWDPFSRNVLDESENGGPSKRKFGDRGAADEADEGARSSLRKVVKTEEASTSWGQPFIERLREAAALPPTPGTLDKEKGRAVEVSQAHEGYVSRAVNPSMALATQRETPDLTNRILTLLREENHELRESTELLVRHEIDLEVHLNATRVRNYEKTILQMAERIDKLENEFSNRIVGETVCDPVCLL